MEAKINNICFSDLSVLLVVNVYSAYIVDGRAMKSLTNTDLIANPLGRSRRKAAAVSYKEPPLNW